MTANTPLRILHVSLALRMSSGIETQVSFEKSAAARLRKEGAVEWDTLVFVPQLSEPPRAFEQLLPPHFRASTLAKWYFWNYILQVSTNYDYVLLRNFAPDPIAPFFAPRIRNLITIHHTKELEELAVVSSGLKRVTGLFLETKMKPVALRRMPAVIGVTKEISEYERKRFPGVTANFTYPNGYLLPNTSGASRDLNRGAKYEFLFVASKFYEWHGLDLLLGAIAARPDLHARIVVHLVGELSASQLSLLNSLGLSSCVRLHGLLEPSQIQEIGMSADCGIGSLALHRKGLTEGATLKVREYLSWGLPVYATHKDSGLPADFPYFYNDPNGVSLENMVDFATQCQNTPKYDIVDASRPWIDKRHLMVNLIKELAGLRSMQHQGGSQ